MNRTENTRIFPYDDLYDAFMGVVDYKTIALVSLLNRYNYDITYSDELKKYGECMKTACYNEHPFNVACKKGYLSVAKCIYDENIDKSVLDIPRAFEHACYYSQIHIIDWLYGILHIQNMLTDENTSKMMNQSVKFIETKNAYMVYEWLIGKKLITPITIANNISLETILIWISANESSTSLDIIVHMKIYQIIQIFEQLCFAKKFNQAENILNKCPGLTDHLNYIQNKMNTIGDSEIIDWINSINN